MKRTFIYIILARCRIFSFESINISLSCCFT